MPILGAAATASNIDPILLMIPAAMSASCAFMLPVATIPNAVVFGTGEVTVKKMAKEGLFKPSRSLDHFDNLLFFTFLN